MSRSAAGPPVRSSRDCLEALTRWLLVHGGFEAPRNLLPPGLAPLADGYFDACLARWEGDDLCLLALLADEGASAELPAQRAEAFRRTLSGVETFVRGRLKVGVWLVVAEASRYDTLKPGFLGFEDAHFLSKSVVGRGLLCAADGRGEFVGRAPADPSAEELGAILVDPKTDPGPSEAERVRAEREARAQRHERDERSAARLLRPSPSPATWALIGVNSAVFVGQLLYSQSLERTGLSPDVAFNTAMLRMGANEPSLSLHGQWWRLLACAFLHGGWWHIGMNMYALFLVGAILERLAGPGRFLVLYFVTALAAGLVSALAAGSGAYSVGASGAIMGVIGALMAPRFRRDPRFPELLAQRLFSWLSRPVLLIFVLGLALRWFDVPLLLDNAAHLGGLLSGFAIGYLWPSFLVRPVRRQA
ncbi:MAG: rhomboid family intramembrane serine protease [bacterium]